MHTRVTLKEWAGGIPNSSKNLRKTPYNCTEYCFWKVYDLQLFFVPGSRTIVLVHVGAYEAFPHATTLQVECQ